MSPVIPNDIFHHLAGSWQMRRVISSGAALHGRAVFTSVGGDRLDYQEDGILQLPQGEAIKAHKRYIFMRCSDGFSVYFDEVPLRLFHHIILDEQGRGQAIHLCGQDVYSSQYDFQSHDCFRLVHTVIGPQKDYTIETDYTRC